MPEQTEIYDQHAVLYEQLVSYEDYQNNLLDAVSQICPLSERDVVELGAGTGRVTRLIAPHVRSIISADQSHHMLSKARHILPRVGIDRPSLVAADHRHLPFADQSADLVIQGWSFLHLKMTFPDSWPAQMQRTESELNRVLRPRGMVIHIETLGTGHTTPSIPDYYQELYDWWKDDRGYRSTWLRTDYRFPDEATAANLLTFFFGDDFSYDLLSSDPAIVPECTGLWYRTK